MQEKVEDVKPLFRKRRAQSRVRSSSEVVMPGKAQTFVHLLMAFLLAASFMQPLVPRAFADDAAAANAAGSTTSADESAATLPDDDFADGGAALLLASSSTDNVHSQEGVAQSLWYTKLIDLAGYEGKDVKGTLNFELVPDDTASGRYDTYDDDGAVYESLGVKPGIATFSYQVPFSSNDFVDPEFNGLAAGAANSNGDSLALFNHALLHEWGRMYSSDHVQTARVGVLSRCQYASDEEYEEALALLSGGRASWPGDPETQIVGWRCFHETGDIESEMSPCGFLGSYEDGCQNLLEFPDFRDGTMKYSESFDLHANPAITYTLAAITRPIAIAKHYDADGNIASIEKPLIPSAEAYKVLWEHRNGGYMDEQNTIYRYKLVEKAPEGMELDPARTSPIIDVVPDSYDGSIYIFADKESADAFYNNRAKELKNNSLVGSTVLGQSARLQLTNSLPKTSVQVSKAWDDADDQDGIRPQSVTVKLLADGVDTGKTLDLSEENGWAGEFADLLVYDGDKKIDYTIQEAEVSGYVSQISGDAVAGYEVRNAHTPSKTSVRVSKAWDDADDQDGIRPQSVTVKLLADGVDTGKSLTLSKDNSWMGIFADLDEYASGKKVAYTVEEAAVDGYEASVSGDAAQGFAITNSHKPGMPGKSVASGGKTTRSKNPMPRTGDDSLPALLAAAGAFGALGAAGAAVRARRKNAGR